ncbi:MAG: YdcF family protein [Clostridia bacterium]|nr:YdcF family protein [Clostridia bacterium]
MTLGAETFVRAVTDFIFVEDEPRKSDVIFIPGASHPEHALKAAELYHQGMAEYLLPSGRYSVTLGHFKGVPEAFRRDYPDDYETEWAYLRTVLMKAGVPEHAILREDQATYTWENAQYSRKVCDGMGLEVKQAILCCRAFHARRAMMYYHAAFPETKILVCPAGVPGESRGDWFTNEKGRRRVMGEVSRLGTQVNEVFGMMLAEKR